VRRELRPIAKAADEEVLKRQFSGGVAALTAAEFSRIILAYDAGLGDWHGPHSDAGNGCRGAPVLAAAGSSKFYSRNALRAENPLRRSVKPDNIKDWMAQVEIDGAAGRRLQVSSRGVCPQL